MNLKHSEAFGFITKLFLAPVGPLQYIFDRPGTTHMYCLNQALELLGRDGRDEVAATFAPYRTPLIKGLLWADRGWKNVCHYFTLPDKQGGLPWPGAMAECQHYFNKAGGVLGKHIHKGMFYLGAALHLVQDMCVPHHAVGSVFDGHQEFERWAARHWQEYPAGNSGLYLKFTHPSQWIEHNARRAARYYSLVSQEQGCSEETYAKAAAALLPLTIQSTAGFLAFTQDLWQKAPW